MLPQQQMLWNIPFVFQEHFPRKSRLSLILLLIWIKNGFDNVNISSTYMLKRRVGQFGNSTICRKLKSEGSYILIYSLFWTCMAFWIMLHLRTFGKPWKLLFENENLVRKSCSSFNKQLLNLSTKFLRFLKTFLSEEPCCINGCFYYCNCLTFISLLYYNGIVLF